MSDKINKMLFDDWYKIVTKAPEPTGTSVQDSGEEQMVYLDNSIPQIETGTYQLNTKQKIAAVSNKDLSSTSAKFRIDGIRFVLPPQDIHSVYPPKGSGGSYMSVIPHIVLNRSILPWEREPIDTLANKDKGVPFLALLLLEEGEIEKVSTKSPKKDLGYAFDEGEPEFKSVKTIQISQATLDSLKSSPDELKLLTHANQHLDKKGGSIISKKSVVLANRIPQKGKRYIAHLVSLEKGYSLEMLSLYSWNFSCDSDYGGLQRLKNVSAGNLHIKADKINAYFKKGYVPMKYNVKDGSKTMAWYHGPLVPIFEGDNGMNIHSFKSPRVATDFLQMDSSGSQMMDTSYGAAWQLGRMLTLQEKRIALDLFSHKRLRIQHQNQPDIQNNFISISSLTKPSLPNSIIEWLEDLTNLNAVPANYLLPHPSMLERESIRFFRMDMHWIEQLIKGALTVGEAWGTSDTQAVPETAKKFSAYSGFIIHSQVIADQQDLAIEAKDADGKKIALISERKLAADILLCIYKSDKSIHKVSFGVHAKNMHFGFTESNGKFSKTVKTVNKTTSKMTTKAIKDISNMIASNGRLNILKLKGDIKATNTADFALKMTEGEKNIEFEYVG